MITRKKLLKSIFFWIILINFCTIFTMNNTVLAAETPKVSYNDNARRDPFVPLDSDKKRSYFSGLEGVESIDDIQLEGVVVDLKGGSIAIVNGVVMTEGEESGVVKLLKIAENGATFSIKGRSEFKPFTTHVTSEVQ